MASKGGDRVWLNTWGRARARAAAMWIGLLSLCGCGEVLGLEEGVLQGACQSEAECARGYTCWRGQCRNACASNEECGQGYRCVQSFQDSACEPNDARCGDGMPCPGDTVCNAALTAPSCFTTCEREADCLGDEYCADDGLCRSDDPDHTPDPPEPDAGMDTTSKLTPIVRAMRGGPCDLNGALACMGDAQQQRLICEDGQWELNGMCEDGQLCDQRTGECAAIEPTCRDRRPGERLCDGDTLVLCGPDLVSAERVPCGGSCVSSVGGASCASAGCGDGVVQPREGCDDGNTRSDDGCTALCRPAVCGDGLLYVGHEGCDDGNDVDADACPTTCQPATCGDGVVWTGMEDCDDGNQINTDACDNRCRRPGCGDGTLQPGELCDDGNLVGGDGCSPRCTWEPLEVTAGDYHTCVRFGDGHIKCWGNNTSGQLGLGDDAHRGAVEGEMGAALPTVDLGGRRVESVAGGDIHTCVILDNRKSKCWGLNGWGQLGLGNVRTYGDGPGEMGAGLPELDLGTGRTVVQILPSSGWTCALLDDSSIRCFGWNLEGEAGVGDIRYRGDESGEMGDKLPAADLGEGLVPTMISARWGRTCAVLTNGRVKCWGFSLEGDLGLGDQRTRGDDPGEMGDNLPFVDLGADFTAVAISAGRAHTCVLSDAGRVKCWGGNYDGQLGIENNRTRGDNRGEMGDALPYVNLGEAKVVKLSAGHEHTCVILEGGQVKCWGWNDYGQLGLGDTRRRGDNRGEMGSNLPAVKLGTGRSARSISAGAGHTCALLDDGSLKCWGYNEYGQLGLGDAADRGDGPDDMGDNLPPVVLW